MIFLVVCIAVIIVRIQTDLSFPYVHIDFVFLMNAMYTDIYAHAPAGMKVSLMPGEQGTFNVQKNIVHVGTELIL